MFNYPTISKYLAKLFASQFILTTAIIAFVLLITNAFDVTQKFKETKIVLDDFWQLISFKIPYLLCEISPLICFITTCLFIRKISKNNELIVILSNGIPILRVFLIPIITTFFIGVIFLTIVSPIGAYGLKESKKIEAKIHGTPHLNFIISQSGIFFFERFSENNRIIQAKSIDARNKKLSDVTILIIDPQNNLIKRIDAESAIINLKSFKLKNSIVTTQKSSEYKEQIYLPTKLSINHLMQTFTPPEMIPIWSLKNSINQFAKSGISVIKYQIYYYKKLFIPLTMIAMSYVACWFVSLNTRDNSSAQTTMTSLVMGVCVYFLIEMIPRIMAYSGFNLIFSILTPILFIILVSNFVILHFQED